MRPILRSPDDVVLVHLNAVGAGQDAGRGRRHLVLGDDAGLRIELAQERGTMARVPDIALGIARHVVPGQQHVRQLVLGHHDVGGRPVRARKHLYLSHRGVRSAHPRQPFDDHLLLLQAAALTAAHDQRRSAEMHHAEYHQAPAALVEPVAHDLVVAVAAFPADAAQGLLLLGGARQIPDPFGARQLRQHVVGGRQEVGLGSALQHDVVELRAAGNLHGVALVGQELERLGDAQGVRAR